MADVNYAQQYSQALAQSYPYVLNYGALYATPNNNRYRITNADTIQIPVLATGGRVDGDVTTIGSFARNFTNTWETKQLVNHRKFSTLVHPTDIDRTNMITSITNITQVFNQEHKFPEMDAYCISKIYADWTAQTMTADSTVLTTDNILSVFDDLMLKMSEARVPENGRILYVTHTVNKMLKQAKELERSLDVKDAGTMINRRVTDIDNVTVIPVPSKLMKTAYDFTNDWKVGATAKQINMFLVYPDSVITPVSYSFSGLDAPTAKSEGKYIYFEESFEDVFILNQKKNGIQFNITTA